MLEGLLATMCWLYNPPHPLVEIIGIEHTKKVLLQLFQWQVVLASCAELSWRRNN